MDVLTIRKVGGSLMVALPKAAAEQLGLQDKQRIAFEIKKGRIVLDPQAYVRSQIQAGGLDRRMRRGCADSRRSPGMAGRAERRLRNRAVNRGDVYLVDLDPTRGHEQRGKRPVLVLTTAGHNKISPAIIAPITRGGDYARYKGFVVPLSGGLTTGVVLCNQIRALDIGDAQKQLNRVLAFTDCGCLRDS
jgi:mRNA interferase ChpB